MNQAIVAARVVAEAGAESTHQMPMPPIGFLLSAVFIFAFLLAVTFAFRSIGHRHAPEAYAPPRRAAGGPGGPGH